MQDLGSPLESMSEVKGKPQTFPAELRIKVGVDREAAGVVWRCGTKYICIKWVCRGRGFNRRTMGLFNMGILGGYRPLLG